MKNTMDRISRFETFENAYSQALFNNKEAQIDSYFEILKYIIEKRYIPDPGALAALYESYLAFLSEHREDAKDEVKYRLYMEALEDRFTYPSIRGNAENYIEREAFCYIYKRDVKGDLKLNESFNARMMIEDHGEKIRYCPPWKSWLIWDGKVWNLDRRNEIYQLAQESLVEMRRKASLLPIKEDVFQLMDHAGRSESIHKIESMVRGASWKHGVSQLPEDFDSDPWIFNCANGILDCRCGRLLPHDREKHITMIYPVDYDYSARCPQWKKFLHTIFHGDSKLIRFVQKALGTCLTGDTSVQSMFILYGTGANGKSTFINTIMATLGNYSATTPTETFLTKKNGDQSSNDIARLKGKRFVSAMESELGSRLAEAMVKRLTGDDVVSARFLYGEYFDFKPTFKIFMATNHKPKIGGMDEAIWRRLKLIPFEVSIPIEKQDRNLREKLARELPGILSWMLEGCLLWLTEGLGYVEAVDDAMKEYRGQMSAVEAFLDAECVRDHYGRIKISKLYERFVSWCEASNERVISKRALGMRLDEINVVKYREADCWYRAGWRLKD